MKCLTHIFKRQIEILNTFLLRFRTIDTKANIWIIFPLKIWVNYTDQTINSIFKFIRIILVILFLI